jgi:alpha-beta hydrolase superfamily lysophospholipase
MRRRLLLALIALALQTSALGAPDPTHPGGLPVGVTTTDAVDSSRGNRMLPTEIWYPARRKGRDVAPLPRRSPLVLIAHGFCGSRLYYDYLATHLASYGFVIAAPDFTGVTRAACDARQITASIDDMALDLSFVRRALHDAGGPLGKWARHVRGIPTALVGNSLGGAAAVEAARMDSSFTAIVGLAPFVNAGAAAPLVDLAPRRAWMIMGATGDDLVSFTGALQPFFEQLPAPAFLLRFTGGSHTGFSDENPETNPDPRQAQHDATTRYATPFLIKYLAHKHRFARVLRSSDDGNVALTARPK